MKIKRRDARQELSDAIVLGHRVMCDGAGSRRFLRPRRDDDGLEYAKVGRVPGVRYEITDAKIVLGDLVCTIEIISCP